jgi:hypothetical protein
LQIFGDNVSHGFSLEAVIKFYRAKAPDHVLYSIVATDMRTRKTVLISVEEQDNEKLPVEEQDNEKLPGSSEKHVVVRKILGLKSDSEYRISVVARTAAGVSAPLIKKIRTPDLVARPPPVACKPELKIYESRYARADTGGKEWPAFEVSSSSKCVFGVSALIVGHVPALIEVKLGAKHLQQLARDDAAQNIRIHLLWKQTVTSETEREIVDLLRTINAVNQDGVGYQDGYSKIPAIRDVHAGYSNDRDVHVKKEAAYIDVKTADFSDIKNDFEKVCTFSVQFQDHGVGKGARAHASRTSSDHETEDCPSRHLDLAWETSYDMYVVIEYLEGSEHEEKHNVSATRLGPPVRVPSFSCAGTSLLSSLWCCCNLVFAFRTAEMPNWSQGERVFELYLGAGPSEIRMEVYLEIRSESRKGQ